MYFIVFHTIIEIFAACTVNPIKVYIPYNIDVFAVS